MQLATIEKLVDKIREKNLDTNKEIYNCLATTTQNKTLLIANSNAQTIKNLNSDPRIKLFKESYNKIKHCFFPIEIPQDKTKVKEARKIAYGSTKFDLITFKVIDASGNNNCQIDTDHESCIATLESEKITNQRETRNKIANDLYGCYGNERTPRNLLESTQDLRNINSFQVFDEEKGLIANQAQKANLKNLSENTGGPVIGFINMIIEYLVGIVFVLCMGSLIYGGYNYIFAGFDSDMQEKGKNAIKYAGIGFFLIMMSYTIVILVQSIF